MKLSAHEPEHNRSGDAKWQQREPKRFRSIADLPCSPLTTEGTRKVTGTQIHVTLVYR